jgi:hypothetical protein
MPSTNVVAIRKVKHTLLDLCYARHTTSDSILYCRDLSKGTISYDNTSILYIMFID